MKAMILAAGEGTRLRPLTLTMPKPMVPVANTPLLVRTITFLREQGIGEIAVNLFHRADVIREALGDGAGLGVHLHYSDETTLMGTAGGVGRMREFLDETFLVLYGDNLYRADFAPLIAFHRQMQATATIATFTAPNPSACGLVVADASGRVTRFQEKPPPAEVFTDEANAGVYVLEPSVLDFIPEGVPCDFGKDIFPALLAARPGAMVARPLNGYLQDTGTVASYRQVNWDVIEGNLGGGVAAEPAIGTGASIAPDAVLTGRNVIGAGVVIEASASLSECIVWDDCHIGAGATLRNAILGRGVRVPAGATVQDDILV